MPGCCLPEMKRELMYDHQKRAALNRRTMNSRRRPEVVGDKQQDENVGKAFCPLNTHMYLSTEMRPIETPARDRRGHERSRRNHDQAFMR